MMLRSQLKVQSSCIRYGIILAMVSFITFLIMRYLDADRVLTARILYWSLFISISFISLVLGKNEENREIKHLIYYPASAMFGFSFIFYFINAFLDLQIQNEVPILSFSISSLICLCYYILLFVKRLFR